MNRYQLLSNFIWRTFNVSLKRHFHLEESKIPKKKTSMVQSSFSKADNLQKNWDEVFKNVPSTICGRQPLKNFK